MFTDIGVNLTNSQFQHDYSDVVERAKAAKVSQLIITGTDLANSERALTLVKDMPGLYATAGVHPHDAKSVSSDFIEQLRKLTEHEKVIAVGECGLDYNRDYSPRPIQEQVFAAQLQLANEVQLPLFMHQRDASDRFIDIFKHELPNGHAGVLHCFTDSLSALRKTLDAGLYVGITGWICDERRGQELRNLIQYIPLDRLLIETDAPFLLPRDMRPKPKSRRNEPAYLPHIAGQIASLLAVSTEELAKQIQCNCRQLFGISEQHD